MIIRLPAVSADIQSESSVDLVLIICWYYLMITCSSCWYSVRFISWPCVDTQWLSDDYLLFLLICSQDHQLTICCYYVDIQWLYDDKLPAVSADIQWGSSVDLVLIICWYTVIIWWLPAVSADIQSGSSDDHVLILCWYTVIIWWLPGVPPDIQSES